MRLTIAVVALLLAVGSPGFAQRPGTSDSATMAQMAGMFTQMGPMYESVSQAMIEGTLKALEKPETIDRLARFARRYYDALIEEALQIVAGAGIAGMKAPR